MHTITVHIANDVYEGLLYESKLLRFSEGAVSQSIGDKVLVGMVEAVEDGRKEITVSGIEGGK